jgi:hypothetical protein
MANMRDDKSYDDPAYALVRGELTAAGARKLKYAVDVWAVQENGWGLQQAAGILNDLGHETSFYDFRKDPDLVDLGQTADWPAYVEAANIETKVPTWKNDADIAFEAWAEVDGTIRRLGIKTPELETPNGWFGRHF